MIERFNAQVILCWPSNRAAIAQLNSRVGPDQQFSPTIEHSLSECDGCMRGIWIAAEQQQMVDSPFIGARKLCVYCARDLADALNLLPQQVDLNPGLAHALRRIA
jgi:hypothetical protein